MLNKEETLCFAKYCGGYATALEIAAEDLTKLLCKTYERNLRSAINDFLDELKENARIYGARAEKLAAQAEKLDH